MFGVSHFYPLIKKKESVLSQFTEWPHGDRTKQCLLCIDLTPSKFYGKV